jgi:hypothetical protein
MQAGAQDYVVKGNFKRLVPAIERGLRDAQMRAQKIQAEQMLSSGPVPSRRRPTRWLLCNATDAFNGSIPPLRA